MCVERAFLSCLRPTLAILAGVALALPPTSGFARGPDVPDGAIDGAPEAEEDPLQGFPIPTDEDPPGSDEDEPLFGPDEPDEPGEPDEPPEPEPEPEPETEIEAAEPLLPAEPSRARRGRYRFNGLMVAGLVTGSIGAAALVTGLATGVTARIYAADLAGLGGASSTGFARERWAGERFRKDAMRETLGFVTLVALPVGGALLATGVVLYAVGLKRCRQGARSTALRLDGLAPSLARSELGITASLRFDSLGRRSPSRCDL